MYRDGLNYHIQSMAFIEPCLTSHQILEYTDDLQDSMSAANSMFPLSGNACYLLNARILRMWSRVC